MNSQATSPLSPDATSASNYVGLQGSHAKILSLRLACRWLWCLVLLLISIRFGSHGIESIAHSADDHFIQSKIERGLTGSLHFRYPGKPLRAKTQRESNAPLGIRLSSSADDSQYYEAKFLGTKEGIYDLRTFLEHRDGSEVTDLPPLLAKVESTLPNDQRSDLFETTVFKPTVFGGYRMTLGLIGFIWLSIPIAYFIRRSFRTVLPIETPRIDIQPTLADQLMPLVEAAASRNLTVREKGRLELLLVHYWRERISLQSIDMASTIRQLRSHSEAGPLVTTLERWLHQSEASIDVDERSPASIIELLRPYRNAAAVDDLAEQGDQDQNDFRIEESRSFAP